MKSILRIVSVIVILVGLGIFLMIYIISNFFQDSRPRLEKESLNIEFSGVVESIEYSEKGYPTTLINNQYIYIRGANNRELKQGDSVVKSKGENVVYQFRNLKLIDSFNDFVIIDSVSETK